MPIKALRNLLIGMAVLVAAAVITGLFLPDTAHVERSTVIKASPATVFRLLNSFEHFNEWSPWATLDPKTQYSRKGPAEGVGASQAWFSENQAVGSGRQEIIESVPNERVRLKVEFTGFDSDNVSTFTLVPEGEGTRLTWGYDSSFKGNLMGRYFGLMLDRMLGKDYENGLLDLKLLAERDAAATPAPAP
ncbi:MAG TPA: SRPBCC family protein [Solimonas sp.]|nr:SRPBCC family protein [Solimonas sp.]